jgi:hypothetical protein
MNQHTIVYRVLRMCSVALTVAGIIAASWAGTLAVMGNNCIEFSGEARQDGIERVFEDWTDIALNYGPLSATIGYELHLPPPHWSFDTSGQGIYRRNLGFEWKGLTITAGTQYALLGKGLTLRSYANRSLRWDTNIDGIGLVLTRPRLALKLLGGRPRDLSGRRLEPLEAAEVQLRPLDALNIGCTYVVTRQPQSGTVWWGSLYGGLRLPFGDIYGEFAGRDFLTRTRLDSWRSSGLNGVFSEGRAFYSEANLYAGEFTLLAEYKFYDDFDLNEGVNLNNPPAVLREHAYTLMNRSQLVQNAGNEKGVYIEACYPPVADQILTLSYSRTNTMRSKLAYQDVYVQYEAPLLNSIELNAGAGRQDDPEARHLNVAGYAIVTLTDRYALKAVVEHQHSQVRLTAQKYYTQRLSLSLSRAPDLTLTVEGEHERGAGDSGRHTSTFWYGMQVDWHFLDRNDLSLFIGSRRGGKVCSSGICVYKSEFRGVSASCTTIF